MEKSKIRIGDKIGTGTVIGTGFHRKNQAKGGSTRKSNQRIPQKTDNEQSKPPTSKAKQAFQYIMFTIPNIKKEHVFHPTRKWRFDFALPDKKIAFEYEGIFSGKSRHTTISGFSEDCEKYNEAALLDWKVFRFTAKTLKSVHKIIEFYGLRS